MIGIALPMVWMNERKQVKIYKTLKKAENDVVRNVNQDIPDEQKNYSLVHLNGKTHVEKSLSDTMFNITVEDSMKLIRSVEMY